jgi:uncharacterized protein
MGEAAEIDRQLAELAATGDGDRAFELGYHYVHEHDDLATAERYYRVAIDAGEQHSLNNLARILAAQGRDDEAEALYRRAVEQGDTRAAVNLAAFLDERGREDEATALLHAHADAEPEAAERLARKHFSRGDYGEAERWFRRAAEDEERAEAITCVGVLAQMRGDEEEAEGWLRRGLDGGDPHAAHHLGCMVRERGDLEGAERLLRRALQETGDPLDANQLAVTLQRMERFDEALALYERAAAGGLADAARNRGWLLEELGRDAEAVGWFERAAAGGDQWGATSLALARWETGEMAEAERLLRAAAPTVPHAAFNLGLFFEDTDPEESRRWLRDAAERGSDEARERLEQQGGG